MPLTPEVLLERVIDALGDKVLTSKIAQDQVTSRLHPALGWRFAPRCATRPIWPSI